MSFFAVCLKPSASSHLAVVAACCQSVVGVGTSKPNSSGPSTREPMLSSSPLLPKLGFGA